jgi:hypothetical protein
MSDGHGYPRPQLRRAPWTSLNGPWEFAFDREAAWHLPSEPRWDGRIIVPFAPETEASGIADTSFYHGCWYRRTLEPDQPRKRRKSVDQQVAHSLQSDEIARAAVDRTPGQHLVEHRLGRRTFHDRALFRREVHGSRGDMLG